MLNTLKIAVLLAAGLGLSAAPAFALQTSVTQVDKNANGTKPTISASNWIRVKP